MLAGSWGNRVGWKEQGCGVSLFSNAHCVVYLLHNFGQVNPNLRFLESHLLPYDYQQT